MKENDTWRKYDSVAESYARVVTPHYFINPAKDLVLMMRLPRGGRFLDIGTGGGAVAAAAQDTAGTEGVVVGVDISARMLAEARRNGLAMVVAGVIPHLPHPNEVFDGVAAGFVLNHVADLDRALSEMVRVGKCEARIGISSWAKSSTDEDVRKVWQEVAENFISKDDLSRAVKKALPSADRFTKADGLETVLQNSGLGQIIVNQVEYPIRIDISDYVSAKALGMSARFMQSLLSEDRWKQFIEEASERLSVNFGNLLTFTTKVNFAVGVKKGESEN